MWKVVVAMVLALMTGLANADFVANRGDQHARLFEKACTNEKVVSFLTSRSMPVDRFYAAEVNIRGKLWQACWTMRSEEMVYLIYEDGDQGGIPSQEVHKAPEV